MVTNLKKKIDSLGNLKLVTLDQVEAVLGPASRTIEYKFTDIGPGYRRVWNGWFFWVMLNFDKNGKCYGCAASASRLFGMNPSFVVLAIIVIFAVCLFKGVSGDGGKICPSCGDNVNRLITKKDWADATHSWCSDCWDDYQDIIDGAGLR